MKTGLLRLRDRLGSDAQYFQQVYNYAFEFTRAPGQRSLGAPSLGTNASDSSLTCTQELIWLKASGPFSSLTVCKVAHSLTLLLIKTATAMTVCLDMRMKVGRMSTRSGGSSSWKRRSSKA